MITHRGIWAIAHMLSRSVGKHSCIPGAYPRKHLLIPCPTNTCQLPLTKARIGLERQRQTRAVWAKRTEYSIEQIRQSLQRLKIAKKCTHAKFAQFSNNWQRFFSDARLRYKLSIIDPCLSQTHTVGHSSRCMLTRSRSSKPPSQSRRP